MFSIGKLPRTPGMVDQYFNDSTGLGDLGEPDVRAPWNQGGSWVYVEAPAFQHFKSQVSGERESTPEISGNGHPTASDGHDSSPVKAVKRAAKRK